MYDSRIRDEGRAARKLGLAESANPYRKAADLAERMHHDSSPTLTQGGLVMEQLKSGTRVRLMYQNDGRIGTVIKPADSAINPDDNDPAHYIYLVRFPFGIRSVHVNWLEVQS